MTRESEPAIDFASSIGISMKPHIVVACAATAAFACLSHSSLGRAGNPAPARLVGRSITVHWTENRDQIDVTVNRHRSLSAPQTLIVYVSSAGRVFSRLTYAGARGASSDQTAGSADATGYGARQVLFNNGTMQVTNAFKGGARQITVTADAGWSSCSARVVYAHDQTGRPMRQINLRGHVQQLISVSISGTSCEISEGNALAR